MPRARYDWRVVTPRSAGELSVLYNDHSLLVVDKPSGLLVHRGWGRDRVTVIDLARELTGLRTVHPVGRLDRGASGVLLLALSAAAATALSADKERGAITRSYLAVVRGEPPAAGVIDHPLPRRPGGPRVPASSAYRVLQVAPTEPRHTALVEVVPRTGRLHQVRRHLKHLGHPLIGDANYGRGDLNREMARRYGLARLALHAARVSFRHPRGGELLELAAPLPADLAKPLLRMGFGPVVPGEAVGAAEPLAPQAGDLLVPAEADQGG